MGMTNTERVTLHRQRKRVGQRPVTVIVSEQEIDFLLAHDYELSRKDAARRHGYRYLKNFLNRYLPMSPCMSRVARSPKRREPSVRILETGAA